VKGNLYLISTANISIDYYMASPKRKRMWSSSSSSKKSKRKSSSSSRGGSSSSSSSLNGVTHETATEMLFTELADEDDPSVIGLEGVASLCEKVDLDCESDIRVLVLLWKMGSKEKPGQITKEEFLSGCSQLQVDSFVKFKKLIPSLDTGFMDQDEFKDFYKFCFQFNRQGTHRTLDKDMVVALLEMVLNGRIADDRLKTFCPFTESQTSYTRITLDQWCSFLDFCYECEDLSTYDEGMSAWPVLIDEYVEYMEEQQQKK